MARALVGLALLSASCAPQQRSFQQSPIIHRIVPTATPTPSATPLPPPVVRAQPAAVVKAPAPRYGGLVRMSFYRRGKWTASGERYDPSRLTCAAARRWPLGISLVLRNPENDRTALVKLNDRGAFEKYGRSLDCSPAVWRELGYPLSRGVVTVEVAA